MRPRQPRSSRPSRPGRKLFRNRFQYKIKQRPEKVPARLHVILAREASKAVVFRRGPSGCVCTLGWDLETDTFTMGQWLKGRIYEYRSDLSPDGKHMIYFATDYRHPDTIHDFTEKLREEEFGARPEDCGDYWKQIREIRLKYGKKIGQFAASPEASSPSWTAISRAPYLKALDLWFNGTAWNGGGLFTDDKKIWLNAPAPDIAVQYPVRSGSGFGASQDLPFDTYFGGECPGVYFHRLARDGWAEKHRAENSVVYEKPLMFGWALQKLFVNGRPDREGYGVYWERHRIINPERRLKIDGTDWRWADFDAPRNRILYAKNGALFALPVAPDFGTPVMLRNFNDMKFEAIRAPY